MIAPVFLDVSVNLRDVALMAAACSGTGEVISFKQS